MYIQEKALKVLKAMAYQAKFGAVDNTDDQAYLGFDLYESFDDIPEGTKMEVGRIVAYSNGILYKVKQEHNKQATWTPDTAHSLFTPIPKASEEGTIDNPIQWVNGMISEKDKYYIDEGVKYLCIESSGIGLYAKPKDLPRYFKKVE